jgi:hypothetical protein
VYLFGLVAIAIFFWVVVPALPADWNKVH